MSCHGGVRIVSRRMVRPTTDDKMGETPETVHLTPWDLQMLTVDYIQMGVLLPRRPPPAQHDLVEHLAQSLARAMARFYPFAGRLVVDEHGAAAGVTVSVRCAGDGAELVHAVAEDTTVSDITGSLRIPRVVWSFFPLSGLVGADAAAVGESRARPVLAAQVGLSPN